MIHYVPSVKIEEGSATAALVAAPAALSVAEHYSSHRTASKHCPGPATGFFWVREEQTVIVVTSAERHDIISLITETPPLHALHDHLASTHLSQYRRKTQLPPLHLNCNAMYSHSDASHAPQRREFLLSGRLTKRMELRLRVREQSSRLVELRNPTLVQEHDLYREPNG